MKVSRFSGFPKIPVCGIISKMRGAIYYHYGERSFNAEDMIEVLRKTREIIGP